METSDSSQHKSLLLFIQEAEQLVIQSTWKLHNRQWQVIRGSNLLKKTRRSPSGLVLLFLEKIHKADNSFDPLSI